VFIYIFQFNHAIEFQCLFSIFSKHYLSCVVKAYNSCTVLIPCPMFLVIHLSRTQWYLVSSLQEGEKSHHLKYSVIHIWEEIPRQSILRWATIMHNRPWHPTTNQCSTHASSMSPTHLILSHIVQNYPHITNKTICLTLLLPWDLNFTIMNQRFIFPGSVAWAYLLT
jgi:hypothetical protein